MKKITTQPEKRKLTKKQKIFIQEYLETGNGVQSALKAYDTNDYGTGAVIASDNLKKPNIREYLESKAEVVAEVIFNLAISAENETVQLNASKDILDRAGYKAFEPEQGKTQVNTYNFLFSPETQADVAEIEARIKARLTQKHDKET